METAEPASISQEQVTSSTGLTAHTLRTLVRRYSIPARSPYTKDDLACFHWIADRLDAGLSLTDAVTLWRASRAEPTESHPPPNPQVANALVDSLLRFDSRSATSMLEDILSTSRLDDVLVDVVQPALHALGGKWECGEATVEQEHFVTNFFRGRLLSWIHVLASPRDPIGRAIAACAPDEQHEMGLLMLSVLLQVRGWVVSYLGQRVPGDRLGEAIEAIHPDVVLFSATRTDHARLLADVARSIPAAGTKFFFGGQAFSEDAQLAADMPGTVLVGDARQAARRISNDVARNP